MRKTITILFALFASLSIQAQIYQPIYGDTMFSRPDSFYYVPWWPLEDWCYLTADSTGDYYTTDIFPQSPGGLVSGPGRHGVYRHYYTDEPMEVTGIAISAFSRNICNLQNDGLFLDTTRLQEYLLLWQREGDTAFILGELEWTVADSHRYISISYLDDDGYSCSHYFWDTDVLPVYEYYFEKPITVHDHFYVGTTNRSQYITQEEFFSGNHVMCTGTHYFSMNFLSYHSGDNGNTSVTCAHRDFEYLMYGSGWDSEFFTFTTDRDMALVFPLYVPKITSPELNVCAKPTGLRVDDVTPNDGVAYISWDYNADHSSWTVAYGDTLLTTSQHEMLRLSGLIPGETYSINVRAHCDYCDTSLVSPWSDTLLLTLPQIGIDQPDTTGEVLSVEYFDLLGRQLAQPPARGLYIRRTTTTQGVSTRKFVRQ